MLRSSLYVFGCFCAYEMRMTFNHSRHLMLPTCVYISSKINPCFMPSDVIFLLLRFHKFFEQTRHFATIINSDVRDSGVSGRSVAPILITNDETLPHIAVKKSKQNPVQARHTQMSLCSYKSIYKCRRHKCLLKLLLDLKSTWQHVATHV
jgi:hypothetical protein